MNCVWNDLKKQIKSELPEKNFSLWINPITLMENKEKTLVLGCPNKFSRNWISENYLGIIGAGLKKIGCGQYKIDLLVKPLEKKSPIPAIFNETKQLRLPNMPGNGRYRENWLNHDFTFDRFIVGKCNEFAYSISKALALGDHCSSHSLFMLAKTGLGKSHLSQAVANAIFDHAPDVRVYYITAEDFVNEMIFSLKNNRVEEFKNKYRRCCDVLLLEEVHFLGGKPKTQTELGYTLDALANDNKKILFTSSLLPKNIPNMSKELSSRLTSGIITTLDSPDYDTRVKIFEKKASEQNLSLSEEIVHFLAKNLTRDVRQMESALKGLKAKSEFLKAKISLNLVRGEIKCHISGESANSINDIKKLVCQYFKIEPHILRSKSRKKIHSLPRKVFAYLCRHHSDATLENIGKAINRNHSTILYASEVIGHKMKTDKIIKTQVDFLIQKLEEGTK